MGTLPPALAAYNAKKKAAAGKGTKTAVKAVAKKAGKPTAMPTKATKNRAAY